MLPTHHHPTLHLTQAPEVSKEDSVSNQFYWLIVQFLVRKECWEMWQERKLRGRKEEKTDTAEVKGSWEQRLLCQCLCMREGDYRGKWGRGIPNANSGAMNEHGSAEESSALLFCSGQCGQRWTWHRFPASGERSGTPLHHLHLLHSMASLLALTEHVFPFSQGILNHCFDDIENFMAKLQQTAEAATVLNQRKKKKKKSKKQSAEGKKTGGVCVCVLVTEWTVLELSLIVCNRRFIDCKGPSPTRGGVHRYLPEI